MARVKAVCFCGSTPGYHAARFVMGQDVEAVFVFNEGETTGEWYRTPRELEVTELAADQVVDWKPDLILTVFYHKLLPKEVFDLPPLGAWNLHLGDPERYRGAFPNIRAILNGDSCYSVAIHRIDSGVDSGDMLCRSSFPLPEHICGKQLYDLMTEKGMELLQESWPLLVSGEALKMTTPQKHTSAETWKKKDLVLELHPPETFIRKVRALTFPPFPPPFFISGGKKYVIIPEDEDQGN